MLTNEDIKFILKNAYNLNLDEVTQIKKSESRVNLCFKGNLVSSYSIEEMTKRLVVILKDK